MSYFARNIRDAALEITQALPESDGTETSADFDLGAGDFKPESVELTIDVPELTATHLPSADTLTITVQAGAEAAPTTSAGIVFVITGTGSTIAAQQLRCRLPSNVAQYVNVKFVAAGTTGDMSALDATIALRF